MMLPGSKHVSRGASARSRPATCNGEISSRFRLPTPCSALIDPCSFLHDAVDDIVELLPAREIGRGVGALGLGQVEVDIAVPDMAEGDRPDAGKPLGLLIGSANDEVGDPADGYGDVVLDRARVKLRLDDRLADAPELLGLRPALGDDPVGDELLVE